MTIPKHKLESVKKIITHANCPDGTVSAIVLRYQFPNVPVRFIQYGTEAHEKLPAEPGMLFCDFSPPRSRVQEFVDAGAIVLDHHVGAKDIVEAFGDSGVYSDEPGVSGAVLAYQEVTFPFFSSPISLHISTTVKLAGIRDTWQKTHPLWKDACVQAYGLQFFPERYYLETPVEVILEEWPLLERIGRIELENSKIKIDRLLEGAYRFTTKDGLRVVIFQGIHSTSDAAEVATDCDLIVGFSYYVENVPIMVVSLRSRTNFDCANFAKRNGGGGHLKAAGFQVTPTLDPYTTIRNLIKIHEAS